MATTGCNRCEAAIDTVGSAGGRNDGAIAQQVLEHVVAVGMRVFTSPTGSLFAHKQTPRAATATMDATSPDTSTKETAGSTPPPMRRLHPPLHHRPKRPP